MKRLISSVVGTSSTNVIWTFEVIRVLVARKLPNVHYESEKMNHDIFPAQNMTCSHGLV